MVVVDLFRERPGFKGPVVSSCTVKTDIHSPAVPYSSMADSRYIELPNAPLSSGVLHLKLHTMNLIHIHACLGTKKCDYFIKNIHNRTHSFTETGFLVLFKFSVYANYFLFPWNFLVFKATFPSFIPPQQIQNLFNLPHYICAH